MRHYVRQMLLLGLIVSLFVGECNIASAQGVAAKTNVKTVGENTEDMPAQTAAPTLEPTEQPVVTPAPTRRPFATPAPTVRPEKYELTNKGAKYYAGGQKGIRYHKVKGKKVYHIVSYTTDTVRLSMSHKSAFSVYGGGSKKEVSKKFVTVSSSGTVKCRRRGRGEKVYTVVQAKSIVTGELQYIYIYFKKKLTCTSGKKLKLYERHSAGLKFDYSWKDLKFTVGNTKKAKISKKGKVSGVRRGVTYITAKVRDSEKNQVKIKVEVREEPWIVNKKDRVYNYQDMTNDLYQLRRKYAGKMAVFSIGKSWDDRNIWCLRIGNPNASKRLVIDAAIHAREWKNSQVVMKQAEEILRDYSSYRTRFRNACVYIIPMANPDGVTLAQYGYRAIRSKKLQKKCKKIGHFSIWKNNARGVNLNYNFPSGFSKKRKAKKPDHNSYPGKKRCSEKETKALMKFINQVHPHTVLNIHSTGSVIYWDFNVGGSLHQKLYNLAAKVRSYNHYRMMPKGPSTNAAGGFGDWLVYGKGIPSITVETGTVRCPLPHSQFSSIYKRNNEMFTWFMTRY